MRPIVSSYDRVTVDILLQPHEEPSIIFTPRAYAQAGLSNRFCPSVVVVVVDVVCHKIFLNLSNGQFRGYNDF